MRSCLLLCSRGATFSQGVFTLKCILLTCYIPCSVPRQTAIIPLECPEILIFLGIEFDTFTMQLRLPKEKLAEIKQRIAVPLGCKKVNLRDIQSIIGLLNFACQVVVPGRAFCRRLIDATCNLGTKSACRMV